MPSVYSSANEPGGGKAATKSRKRGGSVYNPAKDPGGKRLPGTRAERDFVRKHGGGMSVLGGFKNAGGFLAKAAVGIPALPDVIADEAESWLFSTPQSKRAARAVVGQKHKAPVGHPLSDSIREDYKYRFGPFNPLDFHPGRGFRRNYETGFIPLLFDVAGATAVANKGLVASGVLRSAPRKVIVHLPSGRGVSIPVTGSELSRNLKIGLRNAKQSLPRGWGRAIEESSAIKATRRTDERTQMGRVLKVDPYLAATEKLDLSLPIRGLRGRSKQLIAANAIRNFVTRGNFERYIEQLRKNGHDKVAAVYSDSKILDWIDNPTPKMQRALDVGDDLVENVRGPLLEGKVKPESMEQRRWLSLLLLHDAKFVHEPLRDVHLRPGSTVTHNGREVKLESLADDGTATVRFHGTSKSGKPTSWTKEVDVAELRGTKKELIPAPGKTIEGMIDEIRPTLPEGREPRYAPHMTTPEPAPTGMGTGGRVPPSHAVRQNQGFLQAAGRLALNIDSLGIRTLQLLKVALYEDKHASLVRSAVEVESLPKGWEFVKQSRSEKIGHMDRTSGEFESMLDNIDVDDPGVSGLGKEFTTRNADEAMAGPSGGRLAIRSSHANKLIGEFERSSNVVAKIARNTTDVWRALVLNARVAWLVNNIVGNTFLYIIRLNGMEGLKAYFNAFGGGEAKFSRQFLEEMNPDQLAGTGYATQVPTAGAVARTLGHPRSPTRIARDFDIRYEQHLRSSRAQALYAKHPAVRDMYEAMDVQTRTWEGAARRAIANDDAIPAEISKGVSDALGDFLRMSDTERKFIRGVIPFYGWYQAITGVIAKMPLDAPGRTILLANAGRVGMEAIDDYWRSKGIDPEKMPWYLRASVPGFGGMLRTMGWNPIATPVQLGTSLLQPGEARGALDMTNPVLFSGIWGVARAANAPPWVKQENALKSFGRGYVDEGRFLPESRLVRPYTSKYTKGPNPYVREALGYFGAPYFQPDYDALREKYPLGG